ncbi:MAG: hypothetical protein HKN67_02400 [Saprospiraceae bacterium]|nr:hypothetical protein [Bacteroidia bacterium]MBT8229318.1 hypothetical protein [Bacteroidia bacterium]NNF20765.1 hypothetical protein [Saprospiraceae bacterium]
MKKVLLVAAFFVSMVISSYASIIPTTGSLLIVNTAEVEVSLTDIIQKDLFQIAQYSDESNSLDFVTAEEIKSIQIFDANGELQYMLPVLSRKVRISKKMFNKGDYKLGFVLNGHKTIEYTGVKVK